MANAFDVVFLMYSTKKLVKRDQVYISLIKPNSKRVASQGQKNYSF